jgi:phosphoribosyl-ATP pyrophosphohydrolase/phosphoribosyl-AMP cyclohydrolase
MSEPRRRRPGRRRARLRFGRDGLVPVVVQDRRSGRVLTLAYMNRRALRRTLQEGRSVFWSRSRRRLWRKGDTSGNVQKVRAVAADCDGDALLVQVDPAGPACHTGRVSCFWGVLKGRIQGGPARSPGGVLEDLDALVRSRRKRAPRGSYTAKLFAAGLDRILRKVGEEATEVVVAAKNRGRRELAEEAADLLYHLLVLLAERGVGLAGAAGALARRRRGEGAER